MKTAAEAIKLADAIRVALRQPPGTGTRIPIQPEDLELIETGLRAFAQPFQNAGGPTEEQKSVIREAMTDFISKLIGMKPPHDREAWPPEHLRALDQFTDRVWILLRPHKPS